MQPLSVGIVGTQSTHVAEFLRHLARDGRVVVDAVVSDGGPELPGVAVFPDVGALAGQVGAAAVFVRDPAAHRGLVEPLLDAGLRVFVDKPLAAVAADAEALLDAAAASGGSVTSFSALRWAPEARAFRREAEGARREGRLAAVGASGWADPAGPWSGARFYGVHPVELVAGFWGTGDVSVRADRDSATAEATVDGVRCEASLLGAEGSPFTVWWRSHDGRVVTREVPVGAGYFEPAATRIVDFLTGGEPPVPLRDPLVSTRVTDALARGWEAALAR